MCRCLHRQLTTQSHSELDAMVQEHANRAYGGAKKVHRGPKVYLGAVPYFTGVRAERGMASTEQGRNQEQRFEEIMR